MSQEANCNGIKSIEVGARLLAALTSSPDPLPLRDLAKRSRMSASKAHRYLASFSAVGLVEQDNVTREYRLGMFACQMGLAAASRSKPLAAAFQIQKKLSNELNETVFLSVWGAQGATIVRQEIPRKSVIITMPDGYVLPLTRSCAGRVFLAYLPDHMTKPYVNDEERVSANASPCRIRYWRDGAAGSPAQFDFVASVGSVMSGISAIAAPLLDRQGLVAVLAVMGAENCFDVSPRGRSALALVRSARQFQEMGHLA